MRRAFVLASVGVAGLCAAVVLCRSPLWGARAARVEEPGAVTQLPIGQVVLYSSGVGYFQREGSVEGQARVDLSFPVSDINDLIKSMVLRDLDGGHVSAVSYDSNAPIERTLKSFALNLTGNPSFEALLNQARGEKVEVALTQAGGAGAAAALSGTIVGVEKQKQAVGKDSAVEVSVLNLWCSDGVRAVKLSEVQRVRFLNPILEGEFKKALETLAQSHDTQKKAVSIRFDGEGKRRVRVGYVVENPLWKTSYRLVLSSKKEEKPYLQGWAVVENTSDEDWRDVRMALVSGRPISFQMDLYTPLFVPRPVVEPELFASLRPVAYSGGIYDDKAVASAGEMHPPAKKAPPPAEPLARARSLRLQAKDGKAGGARDRAEDFELRRSGVTSAASAAKLGDFFQYVLDKPVSLPRQKSALLPIVGKEVEGTRVSIYNERTQAKFPLLGPVRNLVSGGGGGYIPYPVSLTEIDAWKRN